MDEKDLSHFAERAARWGADYRAGLGERPVRPPLEPGAVARQVAPVPPETGEAMETILADFERVIVPGMTHWQHPRFFAYFPANAAPASVVAEILVAAMGAQCMLWQTSPAATELEVVVTDWLRQALGLPDGFSGVLQDSASTATLAAVLTMRERALGFTGNRTGLADRPALRVYASREVHSSVDKAVWIAGIGEDNLVKLPSGGPSRAVDAAALEAAIVADRDAGRLPAGIVSCVGGTSVGGTDDVAAVADVAARHGLYLHVDAAWAGSAMICPEFRTFWTGVERADSVVVNPHKWLGAQFECSAHFLRDPESLVRTLAIRPEYLKTRGRDGVVNFSEWSVPLGRRFRALKLWFLIRAHGLEGLRSIIRDHVRWAAALADGIATDPAFELVTPPMLSLFSFRYRAPANVDPDRFTLDLVEAVNRDGRVYLTQTAVDGRAAIRFQAGAFGTTEADVLSVHAVVGEVAARLAAEIAAGGR
ncbi:pyridoxal phosphate-dependent decarboxylase family protein [Oharaeibacter diazotrophicus]|uniref:Aromatic-L-amino-acid decarboxylase n=1 Tax=Oharaeibacter diazotrophicus TaxID=1920512 RepID=A0A4R6RCH7_9HYPH|nr:pyridoxal-dependent decarboxylase [Oharaeibacter diazotrophicus]TDP83891.1 aromatic-L-amino-acid decarboxylase [Oharaeibacter diazotrophicus]BBE72933.1 L-2,4-diaminobutyrate decarboxylase [Pleomorphomonas sp. SM30]GLS74712.1 aspartate aminotransferase family protein [Oharaeibacter diazotrophicus]